MDVMVGPLFRVALFSRLRTGAMAHGTASMTTAVDRLRDSTARALLFHRFYLRNSDA